MYDQHGAIANGRSIFGLNKYGPILMVFQTSALENIVGDIKSYRKEITDDNYNPEQHEINNLSDFINQTFKYTVSHAFSNEFSRRPGTRGPASCIYFREEGEGIPFHQHLTEIIVDSLPEKFRHIQDETIAEIQQLLDTHGLTVSVRNRECIASCGCYPSYDSMTEQQVRRFFYETNEEIYRMRLPRYQDL
ncbi:hypothetical protein D1872_208380 [compost metagenome]